MARHAAAASAGNPAGAGTARFLRSLGAVTSQTHLPTMPPGAASATRGTRACAPCRTLLRVGLWAVLGAAGIAQASTGTARPASNALPPSAANSVPQAAGQQQLQDAVASVVVVALTEQFDGKPISVDIDSYDVRIAGARERVVTGRGRVDIEGAKTPVTFDYRTVYDVVAANAGYPAITLASVGGSAERSVPNDATLVGELDRRVADALSGELGGRHVWLQFDLIQSYESAGRYVRIQASGLADFGIDGSSPARVDALYDRTERAWLRVNYELGDAPGDTLSMSGG